MIAWLRRIVCRWRGHNWLVISVWQCGDGTEAVDSSCRRCGQWTSRIRWQQFPNVNGKHGGRLL